MKKYINDTALTGGLLTLTASQVTSFTREATGVNINGTLVTLSDWNRSDDLTLLNKYGNTILYHGTKKIDLLPESTPSNTFINANGLVGVFYTENENSQRYLAVIDLFDNGTISDGDIIPIDGTILNNYANDTNPEYKRVFVFDDTDEDEYLQTSNTKIYQDNEYVYFSSNMDYNLETDDYGYYKVELSNWENYSTVSEFSFFKKQFFKIVGPSDLEVYYNNSIVEDLDGIYWFKDLDIDMENPYTNLLKLKFKSSVTDTHGTIIIY